MNEIKSIIDNSFCGERMSFLQLIKKYSIVIPVIQRDYAQGRKDEHATEVRTNFVRNLISYLRDSKKNSHDLDFVFGTVKDTNSGIQEFVPLDGQQRLTTLFLLHWYLAGRNGQFDDFISRMKVSDHVFRFSYKTRNSSTMFCERLLSKFKTTITENNSPKEIETDIFDRLKDAENQGNTSILSETIQNQGWFYQSWMEDPTIAGMLVTLTEIDKQFLNVKNEYTWDDAYQRLFEVEDGEDQPITFQLLPLNGYSRTDDLYIKLNARGIHLSDFENFKARIEDLIEYDGMNCKDDFKNKVDIVWSEYLWKYREDKDNTDAIMENLFRNFIAFSYRSNNKETMDYLLEQNKKSMRFTFTRYCELGVMHRRDEKVDPSKVDAEKKMIQKVIELFDVFCNDDTTPEDFTCDWFKANDFIDKRIISKDATYHQRLRLYSYLRYISIYKSNLNNQEVIQWMRLVRNLDEATDIDESIKFSQALDSIDDILSNVGNQPIQDWLSSSARNYKISFFRARQMKEECIKAKLMKKEKEFGFDSVEKAVEIGDEDEYFKGQMGFALEFAGVYEKYDNNEITSLDKNEMESIGYKTKLYIENAKAIIKALKENQGKIIEDRLLERALLSLGMYMRGNTANRFNFCNQLNDPYNSWKTLLFVENDNKDCRKIFKSMLDNIKPENNLEDELNAIIINHCNNSDIPAWRRILIENKNLIKYCSQGFLHVDDCSKIVQNDADINIILFGQSQMNHYHSELWSRDLFERYDWSHCTFDHGYHVQRSFNIEPTIFIAFNMGGECFELQLAHTKGRWDYWFSNKDDKDVSSQFVFNPTDSSDGAKILDDAIKYFETIP